MKNKIILARNLRKNSTIQERRLWNLLKNRQFHKLKFKRQQPIGDYIVDFICKEQRLLLKSMVDNITSLRILNMINQELNI